MQTSCFGTPLMVSIMVAMNPDYGKSFYYSVTVNTEVFRYLFDSTMSDELLYEEWGKAKDVTDKLLDRYVGHRVTSAGNLKESV